MDREKTLSLLRRHTAKDDCEKQHLEKTIRFVEKYENCHDRELGVGHITASAWITNPQRSHALMTHHQKLDRWLQLGGHTEDDADILSAALREAREESGLLEITPVSRAIFDVDVHLIPARKDDAEHFHYDIRFLLEADHSQTLVISSESKDLRWFNQPALEALHEGASIDRMVQKMLALH